MSEISNESLWSWKRIGKAAYGILGAVGLFIGLYSFFVDRTVTSFAYSIPEPFKVYDSSAPSGISVLDSAENPIKDDVYLQEIIIWNNGNQPIEPDEVRVPITLKLVPASLSDNPPAPGQPRVLEFKVANETSPSISMVKVRRKNAANNSEIVVSWKHFDRGQAANIQIIYTTPHNTPPIVSVAGQIVGIPRLTNADAPTIARVARLDTTLDISACITLSFDLNIFLVFAGERKRYGTTVPIIDVFAICNHFAIRLYL